MFVSADTLNSLIGNIWRVEFNDPDDLWNHYYDNEKESKNVINSVNTESSNITASGPFKVKF
jgi:hypothetical protein